MKVLPEPGGPWIASVVWSRTSARRRAASRSDSPVRREVVVEPLADPGWQTEEQVASCASRSGRLDPVVRHPWPEVVQGLLVGGRPDVVERDDGARVRLVDRPFQVHGACRGIDRGDLAGRPPEGAVVGSRLLLCRVADLAAPEVVVLCGEPVAPRLLPADDVVDRGDRLEQPDRVVLIDELLGGQVHQPMELPPHRLVLAPMPAEQLGEQPRRLLRRRPLGRVGRDDVGSGQAVDQRLDSGLALGQVGRERGDAGHRARHDEPGLARQLLAPAFQPVAQPEVADHVVAVVALDPLELVEFGSFALAELQPLLEGDDARAGIAQVDLADEVVERPPSS